MAVARIKIYEISKDDGLIWRVLNSLNSSVHQLIQATGGIMLSNTPMSEYISNLSHSIHATPCSHHFIQKGSFRSRHGVVVPVGSAAKIRCAASHKGTSDNTGDIIGLH